MNDLSRLDAPFAQFLGIKLTHVSPERVEAELTARKELATVADGPMLISEAHQT